MEIEKGDNNAIKLRKNKLFTKKKCIYLMIAAWSSHVINLCVLEDSHPSWKYFCENSGLFVK